MGEIIMSVYSQVSSYSDYVDLQHYTGSLASRPQMSGAIYLSGSSATDTEFYFMSKLDAPGLTLDSGASVTSILDQDNMSSNSATALATQQSIKAYVDTQVAAGNDLSVQADSGGLLTVDLADDDFNILGTSNEIEIAGAKVGTEVTFTVGLPNSVTITNALQAGTTLSSSGQTKAQSFDCDFAMTSKTVSTDTTIVAGTTLSGAGQCSAQSFDSDGAITSKTVTTDTTITAGSALAAGTTVSGSGAGTFGTLAARTLDIDSMAGNWTNASRTVADMGIVTTMDLNGGTIDGTTIGASSQTSGKFTTVSGSGNASFRGTLTAVEAASSFAAVTCTTVSGSSTVTAGDLAARTLDIDSMAGNWTNASRTVADLGTITTVDINGGTADALVIGGASAAAGTFTDVSASADGDFGDITCRTLDIDSFAANWTNASRTVADMGTVTTMDLNGGSIDGVTIGTAAAATRLVVQGAGAQSVKSTGANHITLSAGQGESANVAANLIFNASNNITFDAQGTDEDDGFIFSLGADTDGVIFSIENNSGDSLLMLDGGGLMEHNSENKAAADFVFNASTSTDKVVFDSGENCLIVYDGGSETMRLGGDATSDYALDVKDGSNNINKVRAAAFVTYSDERLKTDVVEMNNALKTINSIKAVNFTWKKDGTQDFGFLAQDLKKVIPQAVHGNEDGLLGVDYGRLTSVLVKAIQEQSAQIDALKKKIDN